MRYPIHPVGRRQDSSVASDRHKGALRIADIAKPDGPGKHIRRGPMQAIRRIQQCPRPDSHESTVPISEATDAERSTCIPTLPTDGIGRYENATIVSPNDVRAVSITSASQSIRISRLARNPVETISRTEDRPGLPYREKGIAPMYDATKRLGRAGAATNPIAAVCRSHDDAVSADDDKAVLAEGEISKKGVCAEASWCPVNGVRRGQRGLTTHPKSEKLALSVGDRLQIGRHS